MGTAALFSRKAVNAVLELDLCERAGGIGFCLDDYRIDDLAWARNI
jgi:hypothetical protein